MAIAILKISLVLFIVFHSGQGNSQDSTVSVPKKNGKVIINNNYKFFANNNYKSTVIKQIVARLKKLEEKVFKNGTEKQKCKAKPKNCVEVLKRCRGGKTSGVYSIDPDGSGSFKVYCDQKTSGGGWAVFQRRQDGSVDFYRGWNDYKRGFGNLTGEFWLGLDQIHRLTQQKKNTLRVELEDWKGNGTYAEYDYFAVTSEQNNYTLSLGAYSGTAGDSLSYHRVSPFSTAKDRDNDSLSSNCAVRYKGAWWYHSGCHHSNLNALYHHGGKHSSHADGVNWSHWKGYNYSAKRAEMKIRPV